MRKVTPRAMVVWIARAIVGVAMAAEGTEGVLEVKVANRQAAGVPVVLELTVKNT